MKKPRIAVFGMGTLDRGLLGVPVIIELFGRLSHHYDISFYSFLPFDHTEVPSTIRVRKPVSWPIPGRLKYFLVAAHCAWEHLFRPFDLFYSISVYPAGKAGIILGRLFNKPVLTQLLATEAVALPQYNLGSLTIPWLKKISIEVCRKSDVLVTVSDYQKNLALQHLPFSREIITLPLRIDTEKFQYKKRTVNFPVQFIHIAFYGSVKDQDTLFRAFSIISKKIECHLTVLGGGFDTPHVQKLVHDLSIADKISFEGYVPNSRLPLYFKDAHILLHSSRFEAEPIVVQEAMASGVAVCGSNVGTLVDLGDGYALTFSPGDEKKMAETLLHLVNNQELYRQMTQKAYEWITTYDAVWSYKKYTSLINNVISKT
ncbi:MAG TPA: glycosyltransferase family 4 protein [Ohtaekwangia sp.]